VTLSSVLADAVVTALRDAGVRQVVLCPGSRSAPLAYALQRSERSLGTPRLHVRHDERVAAFTALGMASTGAPSAVVTTSGTAAANLHPAALEAHHSGLPLLLITADRPRTLRGTWANQTSELQHSLFGQAVRDRLDLEATDHLADSVQALLRSIVAATGADGARPGPVHINLGFPEPLVPKPLVPEPLVPEPVPEHGDAHAAGPSPLPPSLRRPPTNAVRLRYGPRTVIVAGAATHTGATGPTGATGAAARALAEATGWPLLAEPSSGARHGEAVIGPYRLLLEDAALSDPIERVVVFGRPTLSRPVVRLLARKDLEIVLVSPWPDWPDPGRTGTRATGVEVDPDLDGDRVAPEFSRAWYDAGRRAQTALDDVLDSFGLSGPIVARRVAASLRPGGVLVAAASNSVRDLDLAAGSFPQNTTVLANRGLSGIDGTLSTATGHALTANTPTRVLVGDLAFLHDLNALLVGPTERRPDLHVVVVNDGGGGIFSLLEYGALAERDELAAKDFDRLFGTPHRSDLASLCRGYGVLHHCVQDQADLESVLHQPISGTSVTEVPIRRDLLRDLHAAVRTAVADAVRDA